MRFVHDALPQRVCFGSGEAASSLSNGPGASGTPGAAAERSL